MTRPPGSNRLVGELIRTIAEELTAQLAQTQGQLTLVQESTEREVLAANRALSSIYQQMRAYAVDLERFKAEESGASGASSFFAVLGRLASAIPDSLSALVQQSQQQAALAMQGERQASSINTLVGKISDISLATKILAVNARIEAARAGDRGSGFVVVADNLRELSKQVDVSVSSIEEMGEGVKQTLVKVARGAEALGNDGAVKSKALTSGVADCQRAYREAVLASLEGFQHRAVEIRDCANKALEHLQFQDRLQQSLVRVAEDQRAALERLHALAAQVEASPELHSAAQLRAQIRELFAARAAAGSVEELAVAPSGSGEVQFL